MFYICGNDETICDGYTDETTNSWKAEIGTAYVEAVARSLDRAGIEYKVGHNFADWHGGRFCQFYDHCGLIAIPRDATQPEKDAAWAADEAGAKARDEYIADLEASFIEEV